MKHIPNGKSLFYACFLLFSACGMDEYYYLEAIPQGNINQYQTNRVSANLPASYVSLSYFTGFSVYYHIYTSSHSDPGVTIYEGDLQVINSSLYSDYIGIKPYTTRETASSTSIDTLFSRYRYYPLELEGANIDLVLSSGGITITIDFPSPLGNSILTAGSSSYIILRSNGNGRFTLRPSDGYVNYYTDLTAETDNLNINADVTGGTAPYCYISLYIVVAGIDPNNLSPIYSNPTWLGVYSLKPKT
jgi:hypothetical protein